MNILELITFENTLIFRNDRPRLIGILMVFFLILFIYILRSSFNIWELAFTQILGICLFVTGIFSLYANFWIAWDSCYFDTIMLIPNHSYNYIAAKIVQYDIISLLGLLLAIPFTNFDKRIAIHLISFFFYNIGINAPVLLYMSFYNLSKINLWKSILFVEGINAYQFLTILLCLGVPISLFYLLKVFLSTEIVLFIIGSIGIIALLFVKKTLLFLTQELIKRKYILLESYRKS